MIVGAWLLLALVHVAPAAVLARPGLLPSLYGIEATGDLGILLLHRGVLFLAIVVVCLYAAWEPTARRSASLVTGISVLGFLLLYAIAGAPAGALRLIAVADMIAVMPLALASRAAWS